MRTLLSSIVGFALAALSATASAQVQATFAEFGSGCPGTGLGIGENHIAPAAMATSYGSGNAIPFGWTPVVYDVPNDLYLLNLAFFNQAMIAEPSANALGYAFSNGGAAVVGNQ